jgi:methylase of polypeptide subunit release factors
MPLNLERTRRLLRGFDFKTLFIEELGWDHYTSILDIPVDGQNFTLSAIAEKRGIVVFVCGPASNGSMPDYSIRRKIERQVTKSHHEHLIIYLNADKTRQVWQWVKRQSGKPAQCREHTYYANQSGDLLIQKIDNLAFSLKEEEQLTIIEVGRRARKAFDVEKVTKKFYDRFKTEHGKFSKFLKGIPEDKLQRWYVSVMLNRLMFIYFIQKKGFLDSNTDYLRSCLRKSKEHSKNGYYKNFLCPLFFEGFAKKEEDRAPETNRLLGKVPYLDGGLFQRHQIEKQHGKEIQIEDAAFDNLFAFFEEYNWHLDERPLRADNEINPDVLGYIFEKYINQKQMGAYYTKEDITGYISKNTIIPFLFDQSQKKCKIAFEGEQSVWRLLKGNPDRYIYDAVKKGVKLDLPEEIAVGIKSVSKRTEWNRPASSEYALPTEIWREVVARRQRYEEVYGKLARGEISSINDLITYNLDIRQFTQDVIENCEGPELLRAIYYTIAGRIPEKSNEQFQPGMSVLDPTCGSGAFLFAALNILEPLYEACLDRMQVFLDELESSGQKHRSDKFGDFRKIVKQIEEHPNRRYFILKSIILNNLYGVDIMEEATEICKLRLFLKLVAQVDSVDKIEPLPDIDFNIRAGNTLVGFASKDEVREAITTSKAGLQKQTTLMFGEKVDAMGQIEEKAEFADRAFKNFRQMQTGFGMDSKGFSDAKEELSSRLNDLADELDRYLASEYGIDRNSIPSEKKYNREFAQWRESHQPFHWFSEFYGIINEGGFDVIIGNPPYVEYKKMRKNYLVKGYKTESCGNLYAFVIERSIALLNNNCFFGMIVPVSLGATPRMSNLRQEMERTALHIYYSSFADRPSCLFSGVHQILSICILQKSFDKISSFMSAGFKHWLKNERENILKLVCYVESGFQSRDGGWGKFSNDTELSVVKKIESNKKNITSYFTDTGQLVAISGGTGGYWLRAFDEIQASNEYKNRFVNDCETQLAICAVFNSTTFYWLWRKYSDCRHLTMVDNGKIFIDLNPDIGRKLKNLGYDHQRTLKATKEMRIGKMTYEQYRPNKTKSLIDEIDRALAKHYGLTDEELDFIINYDIKYRTGLG